MYFCCGFFIFDNREMLRNKNNAVIDRVCGYLRDHFDGFNYRKQEIKHLLQLSIFAHLSEQGDFEEHIFNVYYDSIEHNPQLFGLIHCIDPKQSHDFSYVWSFTPGMGVIKSGDPFIGPISEKLCYPLTVSPKPEMYGNPKNWFDQENT
ncbi:MAG: hypothetical protein AB7I41_13450 [Candidatus Sericytochromatia bacterium]